jgi:hypothetical protein
MMNAATGSSLASLLATIHGLYPQARVTSGYRGQNNPLTQAQPRFDARDGLARRSPRGRCRADPRRIVRPIPVIDQAAGVPVAQAFDEASHPFPWTTGPNWHIAQGPQMAAPLRKKPTLASIAQPIAQLPSIMPMSLNAQPMQPQGASLASLAGGLPQGQVKAPSKFNFGNIAGILGDALMAYGGMQPQFGPNLAAQQDEERQQGFEREKFNAELQARARSRAKAQEPPQFAQNADYFNRLTPEARSAASCNTRTRPTRSTSQPRRERRTCRARPSRRSAARLTTASAANGMRRASSANS